MKQLLRILLLSLFCVPAISQTQIQAPLPAHASPFTGNVRGYYFTAPTCFTITGVMVPTEASTADQSIAIVRFHNNATPPLFATTTNAFTTLFLTQNNPAGGIIPVNIQVEQGDVIGVLGQRGTTNSYAAAGYVSNINGSPMTLYRLGMQFTLTTTAPQQLWTENGGSISRVFLYYDSLITYQMSSTPTGPYSVQLSNGADSTFTSVWDYGDGSPLDTVWDPAHTYAAGGVYSVCSYITNSCGTDTVCTTVTVCGPVPTGGFTSSVAGATANFTDASTDAVSWTWDFGDGSPVDNTQNPSHTYTASGTYTVCQVVENFCGDDDTICSTVTVCVPSVASYTIGSQVFGVVQFTDASTATTAWAWDFGDGSPVDNTQNPSHTYTASGTYTVCLISSSACSADTICSTVTICLPATAAYTDSVTGGTVAFTDASTEATNWSWDFGDGSPVDNTQNPSHTYATGGTYNVCLIAWNACSADTICMMVTICLPATANYTSSVTGGTVAFTDGSTEATGWAWDFGDGSPVDNTQNPSHTYATGGTYNVCLIVTNACSADTFCTTVTVCLPVTANYTSSVTGGTVQFTDASTEATSWSWDFGDSNTSTLASPSHTYATNGTYQVCLIAMNACSSDTVCVEMTICPQMPVAAFSETSSGFNASFTNSSTNGVSYLWDFGDSQTSTAMSPSHTYTSTGVFNVCLTVWNACGDSTVTCDTVLIQVIGIDAAVQQANVVLYPNPFSGQATLDVQSDVYTGAFIFEAYDARGALVSTQQGTFGQRLTVDGSMLTPGVYFYKVRKESATLKTGKLIISE